MAERVGLFEDEKDFDVVGFAPKKQAHSQSGPPADVIRAISEASNFRSREPAAPTTADPTGIVKRKPRLHRTGRNLQFNVKLRADSVESFYDIANRQEWTMGETVERALAALKRELGRS
jgi:hypothetical protein